MPEITAKMVAQLRARTGAGMMDCKKALTEAEGNEEEAITILRKKLYYTVEVVLTLYLLFGHSFFKLFDLLLVARAVGNTPPEL